MLDSRLGNPIGRAPATDGARSCLRRCDSVCAMPRYGRLRSKGVEYVDIRRSGKIVSVISTKAGGKPQTTATKYKTELMAHARFTALLTSRKAKGFVHV